MFYLSEIEHTLRVPPHLLNLPLNEAIKGVLEGLFQDKVFFLYGWVRFLGDSVYLKILSQCKHK